jgi:cell division protein FtsB
VLRPSRLLALGSLVAIGLLYWHPLRAYQHTDALLRSREAQVAALRAQTLELQARIATVGSREGLLREARRLGFVKPGEQLFIVRGIAAWRAHH